MRYLPVLSVSLVALVAVSAPVFAEGNYVNFSIRGGLGALPDYPGSADYSATPDLGLTVGAVKWGKYEWGNGIGHHPENGLSLRGAFKVIGTREAADNPELAGLNDLDAAIELGFGMTYRETNWLAFGELRKGVTGHNGITGTFGADYIVRPTDRWTIQGGPRIQYGNSEYANHYFGVSAVDAQNSQFGAFNANGGALGAGLAVQAQYEMNDDWIAYGFVSYEKLTGSAGNSPITINGSDDQWTVIFGLSREFTLRF